MTVENSRALISVIVPAYNEQESIIECHARLTTVLAQLGDEYELIFVNDGSEDSTLSVIESLRTHDDHVAVIDLSRNFGKEIATTAGLDVADGDAVIIIDADLQDPPELIPTLIHEWRNGFDVVYGTRTERRGESWLKRKTASSFYGLMGRISRVHVPRDTGDFRLLSRRAVLALRKLREQHRFMKGLFTWIGYPQKAVYYQRDPRFSGATKWNYWRLWNFALEGITSFTTAPLRISTYIGSFTAIAAFVYGVYMIIRTLMLGNPVAGYPSLMVVVLFLGGVQLTAIGVLGEYLGRIFNETKNRPLYFLNSYKPGGAAHRATSDQSSTH